jgi:hypothetical protein
VPNHLERIWECDEFRVRTFQELLLETFIARSASYRKNANSNANPFGTKLPTENLPAKFQDMSSVSFTPAGEREIEKLREAWKTLIALQRNIANASACLQNLDLKLTADHLRVAAWNTEQLKKAIKIVGEMRRVDGQNHHT